MARPIPVRCLPTLSPISGKKYWGQKHFVGFCIPKKLRAAARLRGVSAEMLAG